MGACGHEHIGIWLNECMGLSWHEIWIHMHGQCNGVGWHRVGGILIQMNGSKLMYDYEGIVAKTIPHHIRFHIIKSCVMVYTMGHTIVQQRLLNYTINMPTIFTITIVVRFPIIL